MPKDFRDEEFERLLASGELPDIPEPSPERSSDPDPAANPGDGRVPRRPGRRLSPRPSGN